jgi:hypothetical protein
MPTVVAMTCFRDLGFPVTGTLLRLYGEDIHLSLPASVTAITSELNASASGRAAPAGMPAPRRTTLMGL